MKEGTGLMPSTDHSERKTYLLRDLMHMRDMRVPRRSAARTEERIAGQDKSVPTGHDEAKDMSLAIRSGGNDRDRMS